jgi:hypothetical protein
MEPSLSVNLQIAFPLENASAFLAKSTNGTCAYREGAAHRFIPFPYGVQQHHADRAWPSEYELSFMQIRKPT